MASMLPVAFHLLQQVVADLQMPGYVELLDFEIGGFGLLGFYGCNHRIVVAGREIALIVAGCSCWICLVDHHWPCLVAFVLPSCSFTFMLDAFGYHQASGESKPLLLLRPLPKKRQQSLHVNHIIELLLAACYSYYTADILAPFRFIAITPPLNSHHWTKIVSDDAGLDYLNLLHH